MRSGTRRATVGVLTSLLTVAALAAPTPASAAKPSHAGPPRVGSEPLADGAPIFVCGERTITITDGEFVFRERDLPGGRGLVHLRARGGVAEDADGNTYRVVVTGHFRGSETTGRGMINVVLIGEHGEVYRVQLRFADDTESVRGDCELQYPEHEHDDGHEH